VDHFSRVQAAVREQLVEVALVNVHAVYVEVLLMSLIQLEDLWV